MSNRWVWRLPCTGSCSTFSTTWSTSSRRSWSLVSLLQWASDSSASTISSRFSSYSSCGVTQWWPRRSCCLCFSRVLPRLLVSFKTCTDNNNTRTQWHVISKLWVEVWRSGVTNAYYYSRRICLRVLDRSTGRTVDSTLLRFLWNPWSNAARYHGHTSVCFLPWSVCLDPSRLVQRPWYEHCRDDWSSLSIGLGLLFLGRGGRSLKLTYEKLSPN